MHNTELFLFFADALQHIELFYANTFTALNNGQRGAWPQQPKNKMNDTAIRISQANLNPDSIESVGQFLMEMKHRSPLATGIYSFAVDTLDEGKWGKKYNVF